jgi:4-aminobutyrate aminotransferase-like enzyme
MIAVEFIKNNEFSYADFINNQLLNKNIILVKRPGHEVFRIDPALTIEKKDVDFFLNTFQDILKQLN